MSSPAQPTHPLTPPAEPTSQNQFALQPLQTTSVSQVEALLSEPATSLADDGKQRRPRDHRLIHLLLASHGVAAYQERVPLQLMDFAYRYTNSILSDALHIQNEGYDHSEGATQSKGRGKGHNKSEDGDINIASLKLATQQRMASQFQPRLPKEFLKGIAEERNRIGLAAPLRDSERSGPTIGGVRLPHERYCLTGMSWGLKDEWDSEGEESANDEADNGVRANGDPMQMDGVDEPDEDGDGDDDGVGDLDVMMDA